MKQLTMLDRLIHLARHQCVTPAVAFAHVDCLSLSQRMGDLERAGQVVRRKWVTTDIGKRVRAYRLIRKGC